MNNAIIRLVTSLNDMPRIAARLVRDTTDVSVSANKLAFEAWLGSLSREQYLWFTNRMDITRMGEDKVQFVLNAGW